MTDIGAAYNPKQHPLVKSGKITVNEALTTLLDSLTSMSNFAGFITLAQFLEYYANLAAFDENDDAFESVITSLWNVKPVSSGTHSLMDLVSGPKKEDVVPVSVDVLLQQLRAQLLQHGARGIIGLARKFRIIDDGRLFSIIFLSLPHNVCADNSKTLSLPEFRKALKELGLSINDQQSLSLFSFFDKDRDGSISYDEFLVAIRVRDFHSGMYRLIRIVGPIE